MQCVDQVCSLLLTFTYVDAGHPLVVSSVTSFDEAAMESMIAQVEGEEDEEYEDSEQQLPSGLVFAEDSGIEGDEDENEEENEGLFGILSFQQILTSYFS